MQIGRENQCKTSHRTNEERNKTCHGKSKETNKKEAGPSNGTGLEWPKLDESNQLSSNTCCWLRNECNLSKGDWDKLNMIVESLLWREKFHG